MDLHQGHSPARPTRRTTPDGKYSYSLTNTAKINETGQTDTATVDVACYWPQIELTKTGDGLSQDRRWRDVQHQAGEQHAD